MLELINRLEALTREPKTSIGVEIKSPEEEQLKRWNAYMLILEQINERLKPFEKQIKNTSSGWDKDNVPYTRTWYSTWYGVELRKHISRKDTETEVIFEAEPILSIDEDLWLRKNMLNYQEENIDPQIHLPKISLRLRKEWLNKQAFDMVMEQLGDLNIC